MKTTSPSQRLKKWWMLGQRRLRIYRMAARARLAPDGVLPDFLIIGAMKSGTTTLFRMLSSHEGVVEPATKEVQYFNQPDNYARGDAWYRAHFPTHQAMEARSRELGYRALTGEATPAMSAPAYAPNAARLVPDARLIVSLRDPVERAWSHYQHMRRHAIPDRVSFPEAIDRELTWLERGDRLTDDNYRKVAPRLHRLGYINRGQYAEQLEHWFTHFSRDRFLILNFEQWTRDPEATASRLAEHVGLPPHRLPMSRANTGGYASRIPEESRERLTEHFRPWNRRLFELLGEDWGWPS